MAVDLTLQQESVVAHRVVLRRLSTAWKRLRRHPNILVGAALLTVVLACAVAPAAFEPHDPMLSHLLQANQPISGGHWFGTDQHGRDVFSRVIAGTRASLLMGIVPVLIGLLVGGLLGLVSGYYRRLGDWVLMRIAEMLMAFPGIVLALMIVAALGTHGGSNSSKAMLAIGIALVPTFARVARSAVLVAGVQLYVDSARATGCGGLRILGRHSLPNIVAPLIVLATLAIAGAILAGASLSFLGLGAQPPVIEWGAMINDGRQRLDTAWWISTLPGVWLMAAVIAINLVGDGVRDLLDPRMRL